MRIVLFYRDIRKFSGGHLKVWDYFNHVSHSRDYVPYVYFPPEQTWEKFNPWSPEDNVVHDATSVRPDALFVAGRYWRFVPPSQRASSPIPIINLIQSLGSATPGSQLRSFLSHKAIRICVSPEVAEGIAETGEANGPVFTIPNAIDFEAAVGAAGTQERDTDLLIVADKRGAQELGKKLLSRLQRSDRNVQLLDRQVPRPQFLNRLSRSRVTLFLPEAAGEGFYLPALEGMALGTVVVCPDCIGNRSFCIPEVNCFRPEYTFDELVEATELALQDRERSSELVSRAQQTAREHDLPGERRAFLEILGNLDSLWAKG